jgi:hypothetical protein
MLLIFNNLIMATKSVMQKAIFDKMPVGQKNQILSAYKS